LQEISFGSDGSELHSFDSRYFIYFMYMFKFRINLMMRMKFWF